MCCITSNVGSVHDTANNIGIVSNHAYSVLSGHVVWH